MYGFKENPAFNPNEICDILDIKNDTDRLGNIRKQYKYETPLNKAPKVRGKYIKLISERGMYEIIMSSRSKIAQELKDFISDLLINIRLNGELKREDLI